MSTKMESCLKKQETLAWQLNTSNGFYIARHNIDGALFNGKIDEVKIYNRALSALEISNLYNQSVNIEVEGNIKGLNSFGFNVQCQNITTGQTITVNTTSFNFNCETAGLIVNPNDAIHINIDGKAK